MTREEIDALCALAEQHDKAATRAPWFIGEDGSIRSAAGLYVGEVDLSGPDERFTLEARAAWPALAKAARALLAENARLQAMVDQIEKEAL